MFTWSTKHKRPTHMRRAPLYARIFDSTHIHSRAHCWPLFCSQRMCRFKVWIIHIFFFADFFAVHYMVSFIMNSIQWFESKRAKDKRSLDIRPSNARFLSPSFARINSPFVGNTEIMKSRTEKNEFENASRARATRKYECEKKAKEQESDRKNNQIFEVQKTNCLQLSGRSKLSACLWFTHKLHQNGYSKLADKCEWDRDIGSE